jgi:hypothetical protein
MKVGVRATFTGEAPQTWQCLRWFHHGLVFFGRVNLPAKKHEIMEIQTPAGTHNRRIIVL